MNSLIESVRDAEAELVVVVGRSKLIETKRPLTRILVANPGVADVELLADEVDSRQINLYGRAFGTTNLTLWDADRHPTTFLVRVTIDTRDLESRFKQIFPGADVRIRQAGSQLILEGQVPDARTMAEVLQLLVSELRLEVNNAQQVGAAGTSSGGSASMSGSGGTPGPGVGGAGPTSSGGAGRSPRRLRRRVHGPDPQPGDPADHQPGPRPRPSPGPAPGQDRRAEPHGDPPARRQLAGQQRQ